MACYHPIVASRTPAGDIAIAKASTELPTGHKRLHLRCGKCLGCITDTAKTWALRCFFEHQQHENAAFSTLTYSDETLPPTLQKRDLQLGIKRIRHALAPRPIRFFASGEYGEQTHRPHYHAILFGASVLDAHKIETAWKYGHVRTDHLTPARICYTAGYTAKKINFQPEEHEQVDYETGEIYTWQPPFIQMSRGGRTGQGIGGHVREHWRSWRDHAILNGIKQRVPRYYHEAWKEHATEEQKQQLEKEQEQIAENRKQNTEYYEAAEKIAITKHQQQQQRRKY